MSTNGQQLDSIPVCKQAERQVLGSCMRDSQIVPNVLAIVRAQDFFYDPHKQVFSTIAALYDHGHPTSADVVADRLKAKVEDFGGYSFFGELLDAAPTGANADYYAKIVRDTAIRRSLIRVATEIVQEATRPTGGIEELLEKAERMIFSIAEFGTTGDAVLLAKVLDRAYQRIDEAMSAARGNRCSENAIRTGFVDLDEILGGFQKSDLIVLAARPSLGKTTLAMNIIRNVAIDQGVPILCVSLEQTFEVLTERLLCSEARVNTHRVRLGYVDERESQALIDAGPALRNAKVWLGYYPRLYDLAAQARRLATREKIGMIVVDYIGLIHPPSGARNRQEEVAQISRSLKQLAKDLNVPVVALSQLNRLSEERADRRPRLSDLRDSGQIEQDADTVLLLHQPDQATNVVEVSIAKNRNGPVGEVRLYFKKEFARFENCAY